MRLHCDVGAMREQPPTPGPLLAEELKELRDRIEQLEKHQAARWRPRREPKTEEN